MYLGEWPPPYDHVPLLALPLLHGAILRMAGYHALHTTSWCMQAALFA
jgi:hypothetical protein